MTELPRVLALTPAYNGEAFLQRTLDSLAAQTYPSLRVLIADDASTDATADIAQAYVQRDSRFSLVRRTRNLGWIGNANAMLGETRGQADYMLFAFHDDVLFPEYVARLAARLDARPDAILAFSDAELTFEDQAPQTASFTRLEQVTSARARTAIMARMPENWWIACQGMFPADAAQRVGGLKRSRRGEVMADWPWLVRLASIGGFEREPEILMRKCFRKSSVPASGATTQTPTGLSPRPLRKRSARQTSRCRTRRWHWPPSRGFMPIGWFTRDRATRTADRRAERSRALPRGAQGNGASCATKTAPSRKKSVDASSP
jgi:glycosyltransferase involved in cell wall biosynthesis